MLELPGWVAAWWLWGRPRLVAPPSDTVAPDRPATTVIIPARDEAAVLPLLLADLEGWAGPGRRIIVVDDHSTDGTGALARAHLGVEVLDAPALPTGWAGKSWACHVGAQAAAPGDDDALVFVDADVRLDHAGIDAAVDTLERTGGLVSVQPHHQTERPYEQLSLYPGIVGLMGTGAGQPERTPAGAFGPVLATSGRDYAAIGGHAAVRHELAEDVALGLRYREAGLPVHIFLGGSLVRFRMYPGGLGQLVEGWTKNMAIGAGAVARHRTALVAAWIAASGSAAMSLPLVPGNAAVPAGIGLAIYALYVLQIGLIGRRIGTFGWATALAYPIALVTFMALFFRSAWRLHVRRSVRWRGRTIGLGSAPP